MTSEPWASITSRQPTAPFMAAKWNLEARVRGHAQKSVQSHPNPWARTLTQTCPRGPVLWGPALCVRSTKPLWPHHCSPRPGAGAGRFCPSLGPVVAHPEVCGTEWFTVPSPPRNKGSGSGLSPTHSWALAWRLPLVAGFGIGHGPQGGQEPRSVGLSRSCGVGGPGWGPRDSVSETCTPQHVCRPTTTVSSECQPSSHLPSRRFKPKLAL